jgi:hypothetical protein
MSLLKKAARPKAPGGAERDDLHLLYQETVRELEFFKRQQWIVTNYALLLYAGIVGLERLLADGPTRAERIVLTIAAVLIGGAGVYIIKVLNNSIDVRQVRLRATRMRLSTAFTEAFEAGRKPEEAMSVYWLLTLIVAVGAVACAWLVGLRL